MNSCFYCENGEKLKSLMIPIKNAGVATIYLNRDQKHPGRCIVALNQHKTEVFQLTEEERNAFFKVVSDTAEAIFKVFSPNKINYATYGDLVPHLHVHIVPKYENGLNWGNPFDDTLPKKILTDEEYKKIITDLASALNS